MTKQELWKVFSDKNPQFNGDGQVTMSAAGLRKFFETAFDQGHSLGFENGKAFVLMDQKKTPDIFGSIFGGKR